MNFFDAQEKAKRATRWLVVVYVVSTALIVAGITGIVAAILKQSDSGANLPVLGATAVLATLFILGATLYKTAALSAGGGRVAQDMGGTLVSSDARDPLHQRLRNVVEEMSIASGIPMPDVYVLEAESGINAFAAGYSTGDAAIAVTRGTLETLNRSELQGVIAHEFSHILNGDMRLNIRMMGVLFGIMVLGIIGRMVLRGAHHGGLVSSRRDNGAPVALIIGLGLTLLGWIGVFFSRLIKAAVSRQREFLADASAVQFTRETDGIANALKKIGGYSQQSYFRASDPEEVSHMLFATGVPKLASLFATHPPLPERIRALDPSFKETDYPTIEDNRFAEAIRSERVAGFAAEQTRVAGSHQVSVDASIVDSIGQPGPKHIDFAGKLRRSIPETLYEAAHSSEGAYLLAIALIINQPHADHQFDIVAQKLGPARTALVRRYFDELQSIGSVYRLPLLEISFPELKHRPALKLEFLLDLIRRLIDFDGKVDLQEFCYYRIITQHLEQSVAPAVKRGGNRTNQSQARSAAVELLRIVADHGHTEPEAQDLALAAGLEVFGAWASADLAPPGTEPTVERLGDALDILARINTTGRQSLIQAVTKTIAHDGRLSVTEAELLRAVCASLDIPLPPIISAP